MNYKETLHFIGKCLTINSEKHNLKIIEKQLSSNNVNWDAVVKVGTSHFIFSALYNNLKKAKLLHFLPHDLVEYMRLIMQLNHQRNEDILAQAKEINKLLLMHNITPIFLKGVGNIAQDFYNDIGERMISDIDFIVSKKEYRKAVSIMQKAGYSKVDKFKDHSPSYLHFPRLQKEGYPAAIEIHKEMIIERFTDEFNYDYIKNDCIIANELTILSYDHQLCLSILSNQINDDGFYYKNLTLKNAYDVYLLSKKTSAKNAFQKLDKLKYLIKCFLASCNEVFNKIDSLQFNGILETEKYVRDFNCYLINHKKRKRDYKLIKWKLSYIRKRDLLLKLIVSKELRNWYWNQFLIKLKIRKFAY